MKPIVFASALFSSLFSAAILHAQEVPSPAVPEKEHQLLDKLVGEWESESEATLGPGVPVMKCKGTMSSRSLGGLWIVSDVTSDMLGTPMTAVQTIGYDPGKKKYVGTWVDSVMNHMWIYEGTVDETGKILTLEAEGPDFAEPGKLKKYRDAYEFKSADHIVATSSALGDDGKWVTFMTGQIRRVGPSK